MGPSSTNKIVVDQEYLSVLLPLIKRANKSIKICTYAWRIYRNEPSRDIQKVIYEINRAVRRGVIVQVISDKYQILRELEQLGVKTRFIGSNVTMHAKAVSRDESELIIGSHNLTASGTEKNRELSIYTTDIDPILQYNEYFNTIWDNLYDSYAITTR